jgi:serine/threonine protein kinase
MCWVWSSTKDWSVTAVQGHAPEAGWYLVLDWVGGQTMRDVLDQQQTLSWPQLDLLLTELLAAVQCLHDAEVIHRDIHVGNIHWLVDDNAIRPAGPCCWILASPARSTRPMSDCQAACLN